MTHGGDSRELKAPHAQRGALKPSAGSFVSLHGRCRRLGEAGVHLLVYQIDTTDRCRVQSSGVSTEPV